jgi:hypothetical protein
MVEIAAATLSQRLLDGLSISAETLIQAPGPAAGI